MALVNLQGISIHFGSHSILDDIDLQIHGSEKICLLGRNGAGKSTLMKIINGDIDPESGSIIKEKGIKTALLQQEVPQIEGTVHDLIAEGITTLHSMTHLLDNFEESKARSRIEHVISLLSLDGNLLYENLSAGMKRRVLIGRALAGEPDILLLDEPTNHLDIDSIRWLEDFLSRYDRTVFFVTHDRAFLQMIAGRILEIDRGRLFDWKCGYKTFLERKDAWLDSEETQNSLFDKKLAKEEAWIRRGVKARRSRNEGRVRALIEMRKERARRREQTGKARMEIQKADNSGKMVIEAEGISFGYSGLLFSDFSARIMRGDKIGIIGPNGCGKSTLIKVLLGEIAPMSGTVRTGTKLEIAYFDQLRNRLDEKRSVRENVTDGNEIIDFNGRSRHVVGYLQDFLFSPDRIDMKVSELSGGEKNRLLLAKLFTRPSNFLVFDEPTNDLDIETIELLEELLLDYEGTLILVSHDRAFLNNVVTATFAFEEGPVLTEYAGGYDEWINRRKAPPSRDSKQTKSLPEKNRPVKIKLSMKEKKELESLPHIVEEKEKRKQEIFNLLGDPGFYQKSGMKVAEVKTELETIEKELDTLFTRWEELEDIARKTDE